MPFGVPAEGGLKKGLHAPENPLVRLGSYYGGLHSQVIGIKRLRYFPWGRQSNQILKTGSGGRLKYGAGGGQDVPDRDVATSRRADLDDLGRLTAHEKAGPGALIGFPTHGSWRKPSPRSWRTLLGVRGPSLPARSSHDAVPPHRRRRRVCARRHARRRSGHPSIHLADVERADGMGTGSIMIEALAIDEANFRPAGASGRS
jgi:hypothetical protein